MSDAPDWRALFGHPEPYPAQEDGIETVRETASEGGYVCLEGACGTGKTMLALTAGLSLVRDPETDYERVLALTSVKQQLRQFEADVRTINEGLDDEPRVTGLTLVGKADVCPYARETTGGIDDRNVYDRCEGLRERTRGLTGDDGPTTADALAADARRAQTGLADSGGEQSPFLETAGEPTPYLPETAEHYGEGADPTAGDASGTEYCPFYAQHLANTAGGDDGEGAIPFDVADQGMIDTERLVGLAAGHGTCPHSVMGAAATEAEVVVGNYYHAFDPITAGAFTGALLDDSTFVVCDEAHMLEPRVRDLVSDGVGVSTLEDAEREINRVLQPLEFDDGEGRVEGAVDAESVRGEMADSDVTPDDLRRTREFLRDLRGEVSRRVEEHLDRAHPNWQADESVPDDEELPLRKPDQPAEDAISQWAREAGYGDRAFARAPAVGAFTERVLAEVADDDRQWAAPAACRVINEWKLLDHETYFREIELERTRNELEPSDSWRSVYNARLALHNCVPAEAIGAQLAEFGGGVLMSATLAPMDVFREVTGLSYLADEGRPVVERTYPLSFPTENRASFAVDAPKFTYDNRGPTVPPSENRTRQVHVDCVTDVIETTAGNVLVGAPNYREAAWLAECLDERVERPVLVDESSSDAATESLKAEFFDGPPKVLVTSIRGTLTEGVDYRGDRLAAAVVCGVPIISTRSPRTKAVQAAYDRTFDRDGFEVALTVPAVRKARQAIGRVIRGPEEVGVRVFVDGRYARDSWNSVREFFPEEVRDEFRTVSPDMLRFGLEQFWDQQ